MFQKNVLIFFFVFVVTCVYAGVEKMYSVDTLLITNKEGLIQSHKEVISMRNATNVSKKAELFYNEVDTNPLFKGTCAVEDRSRMNACFLLNNPALDEEFMKQAKAQGIVGIKGHRSVGGFRASMYNALPLESVKALTDLMKDFALKTA